MTANKTQGWAKCRLHDEGQCVYAGVMWRCGCWVIFILTFLSAHGLGQEDEESRIPPREVAVSEGSPSPAPQPIPGPVLLGPPVGTAGLDGRPDDPNQPIRVAIMFPANGQVLDSGRVDLFFKVENYTLRPGGNRLHVFLNNEPPRVHADPRAPLTLESLAEGGHVVRVVPVGPQGQLLLNDRAWDHVRFYVRRKNFQNMVDFQAPMLLVNLPMAGLAELDDQERVRFDFRVFQAQLGQAEGFRVRYILDTYENFVWDSAPIFWGGLSSGKHRLVVELVDSTGQVVPGLFNRVEREFYVKRKMPEMPAPNELDVMTNQNAGGGW